MHKSATKCNETVGKWCKNKHGASKIIDTLETYQVPKDKVCTSLTLFWTSLVIFYDCVLRLCSAGVCTSYIILVASLFIDAVAKC
jgi:hypothetical protein